MDKNELEFKKAINDALVFFVSDLFRSLTNFTNKCSDGFIEYDPVENCDCYAFDVTNAKFRDNVKRVVIVLESPHVDEYSKKEDPICAKGQTGENLKSHLKTLLHKIEIDDECVDIVIVNAVPYQCSQGVDTEILRDFVWLKCWYEFGYSNILELLDKIDPDYIVNCCTKGCHFLFSSGNNVSKAYIEKVVGAEVFSKEIDNQKFFDDSPGKKEYSLREFVSQCLRNYKKSHSRVELYRCTHPCTWSEFPDKEFQKIEENKKC